MSCRVLGILILFFSVNAQANIDASFSVPSSNLPLKQKVEPELLVFISFGMPEQSLKLWAMDASRAGGKLLLRGFFENSLQKTAAKTIEIFGQEPNVDISIDPEQFQQFKIDVVPAVVIVQRQETLESNNALPDFDVVYGDTTLEAALERISQSGSPEGQKAAKNLLKRYRETHD